MNLIENRTFDEERALYGSRDLTLNKCKFDGPADGESALKESENIITENCFFNLRYPFWHDKNVKINNCEMTALCRAALWYSNNIEIRNTKMHGIKALRECSNINIKDCDIISPEFGWSVHNLKVENCTAQSEYFMLRAENIEFNNVNFNGKYSFQYIKNAVFEDCVFNTKDAFWHAEDITVKNSIVKGEYLAWYSKNIVFENCKIIGTQPLCYCEDLKLINCEMIDADLAFEYSSVDARINGSILSVKNPKSGRIIADSIGEIITGNSVMPLECKIEVLNNGENI